MSGAIRLNVAMNHSWVLTSSPWATERTVLKPRDFSDPLMFPLTSQWFIKMVQGLHGFM